MITRNYIMFSHAALAVLLALALTAGFAVTAAGAPPITQGSLQVTDAEGRWVGQCPLKHTEVHGEISGFLARVRVVQLFTNPYQDKIEAVYTFPLPQNAAVDDMTLTVGDRTVRGRIKTREEARAVYEAARAAGHVAGLLDQERPNIFTQSVANIMPGQQVRIAISYVETLPYEDGAYGFVFPMVVGPRYIPGNATGKQGGGWSPDTDRVPDASRITPPVSLDPNTMTTRRAGHDISIDVAIDAGVPISGIQSVLHDVETVRPDKHSAVVRLRNKADIPNRDFILKYNVAGNRVEDAVLTHRDSRGGFFAVVLQPPERVDTGSVSPKELVFVIDTSGSMSGFPIEKAKETIRFALANLNPRDTFNLITFSGDTRILFPQPVPATPENVAAAQGFLASQHGSGGTEMMKAIAAALDSSDQQDHVRIVCFMTDGYVGNDMEIIAEVQKHPNARVFSFGIGNSVNRFLLDKMAEYGRGEVEYVTLTDDGSAAARRFYERVRNPLITDIKIDWGRLAVTDIYPSRVNDLFSARPIVIYGRYERAGGGIIRLSGRQANGYFVRELAVNLPDDELGHDVLATLWARSRVADLMGQDYLGMQRGVPRADVRDQITRLGLDFRLMTQYTSFVAVEELTITDGGQPRKVEVPVEMPDGVDPRGVFGEPGARGGAVGGIAGVAPQGINYAMVTGKSASAPRTLAQLPAIAREEDEASRMSRDAAIRTASPEDKRKMMLASKLHSDLLALVESIEKNTAAPAASARFVSGGKARVQVWLTRKSEEDVRKLKLLGFEVVSEAGGGAVLLGRVPVAKLVALAELDAVRYVAPF